MARTIERLRSADPALASEIGLGEGSAVDIERTVVRSRVPSELAVLTDPIWRERYLATSVPGEQPKTQPEPSSTAGRMSHPRWQRGTD